MTSSHVAISLDTFKRLLETRCIVGEWFLQNLPKVKEELGMMTYYRLTEMAVDTVPQSKKTEFYTCAEEGKTAHEAQDSYRSNPYNPIREGYKNAGWAFGWIRSEHGQM